MLPETDRIRRTILGTIPQMMDGSGAEKERPIPSGEVRWSFHVDRVPYEA